MPDVQVDDVPDDVLALLEGEATRQGQSLQGYLRELLTTHAGMTNNSDILGRVKADLKGLPEADDDVVEIIRQERAEGDRTVGIGE
jgi:hypothetical protein